jgi:uncharacterized membrane protein YeaQ/YmgE (transglycosylase-associated protein family)
MGIIAWIALGMAAALLANILLPGKRSLGLIFICLTSFTGTLGGGWAVSLFRAHGLSAELGSFLAREQAAAGPLAPHVATVNGTAVS